MRFTGVRFRNTSFARAKLDGIEMEGVRLDARAIVGADYRTFLRGCTGCDLREMSVMRDVQRQLRILRYRDFMVPPIGIPPVPPIPAIPALPPIRSIPPVPPVQVTPPEPPIPPAAPAP